jgi:hypothetical protein
MDRKRNAGLTQRLRPLGNRLSLEQELRGDIALDPMGFETALLHSQRIVENLVAMVASDVGIAFGMTGDADPPHTVLFEQPGLKELDCRIVLAKRLRGAATQYEHLAHLGLTGECSDTPHEVRLIGDKAGGHMRNGFEPQSAKPHRGVELACDVGWVDERDIDPGARCEILGDDGKPVDLLRGDLDRQP